MKRLLFIYNPHAGKELLKPKLADVIDIFVKAGYEVVAYPTQAYRDAYKKIKKYDSNEYDLVVCSGGDGTLDEVVTGMMKRDRDKRDPIGYRDAHTFLKEEFEQNGTLYISTEDGSVGTKGNVMDAIREQSLDADIIFACGPTPMLRAIKAYAEEKKIECYISLEERMACGIGACLACVCKTKEKDAHSNVNNKRICKDGPVFLSTEVDL